MNFRKLIPLIFAAKSIFMPQVAISQDFTIAGFSPSAEISFVDGTSNLDSSIDLAADKNKTSADLEIILSENKVKHNFGASFLVNKDPVWTTINGGLKYGFKWEPIPFIKQELKTFTGYQNISNVKYPFLYSAGQFFSGGEENLSFILGEKDKARLEAKGTLGGYVSFLNKSLMWDHYKVGYGVSGTLPISFFNFNVWFSQNYTQFNKDKYFFIDSSNNLNFGARLGLNLEELALNAFFEKEYNIGKELEGEKIYTGINALFREAGVGLRGSVELNQLNPELWKFNSGIGKTVFQDRGYFELFFGLANNQPSVGIGLRISPSGRDTEKIIIEHNSPKYSPLIEEQGYEKPSENFEEAIDNTDTLTKIGNVGNYFPYGTGLDDNHDVRTPEEFFEDGFGDCDEIALYRTYAARQNGYDNSWAVGYIPAGRGVGHAFFLVQDKDGRVYVTDNDSGVWLRIYTDSNASKEQMAKAAIEQASRYMALTLPEGQDYSFFILNDTTGGSSNFQSKDKGYAPIDTGLMSRTGKNPFY